MGFLDKFFGERSTSPAEEKKSIPWNPLIDEDQLKTISEDSYNRPQMIYKHSTTCGISSMVLNMFSRSFDPDSNADLYFLDIHQNRVISNLLSQQYGVRHESPQLLMVRNGEVSVHRSHGAIADMNWADHL